MRFQAEVLMADKAGLLWLSLSMMMRKWKGTRGRVGERIGAKSETNGSGGAVGSNTCEASGGVGKGVHHHAAVHPKSMTMPGGMEL